MANRNKTEDEDLDMQSTAKPVDGIWMRGVWRAGHLQDGHHVAIAVDSRGRQLAAIQLVPGIDRAGVKQYLAELLDLVDPVRHLHVLQGADSSGKPVARAAALSPGSFVRLLRKL